MPPLNTPENNGRNYWRSLDQMADTPEFREFMYREFPAGASELLDSGERRHFLKIMGASMALAGMGLAGCRRWPEEIIAPYASRPELRTPGVPVHYATCMLLGGVAQGLLVTSYDGRPVKIEGNPSHPMNMGATDAFAQASVLDLYDPDRSRTPMHNGAASTWDAFVAWATPHFAQIRSTRGEGLAILAESSGSPSLDAMRAALMSSAPQAKWYHYTPLNDDNVRAGTRLAFGSPHRIDHNFERARVVVSLDADFLGTDPVAVRNIRQFARSRDAADHGHNVSRLYQFESTLSVTGANADVRRAVRSADVGVLAGWLASQLIPNVDPAAAALGERSAIDPSVVEALEQAVVDLKLHAGESIVTAGAGQPAEVHMMVTAINQALSNVGGNKPISYLPVDDTPLVSTAIQQLANEIDAGNVSTLVILGGNPVYNAPADLDFAGKLDGLKSAGHVVHLASHVDETSTHAEWHINQAHYLEAWNDGRSFDGTVSICQPLIRPLFNGKSDIELVAMIAGASTADGYDIVREVFGKQFSSDEAAWRQALHDGIVAGTAVQPASPRLNGSSLAAAATALAGRDVPTDVEFIFTADPSVYDGRFANNGWMQELPDPITKLTWDNAALVSPAMARQLGLSMGDTIKITIDGRSETPAVMIVPGHAANSVTLPLGYGRAFKGRICEGSGFDFYKLRSSATMHTAYGQVVKAGAPYPLATTQDHHTIDVNSVGGKGIQDRLPSLFREATVGEYADHPNFAAHRTHVVHRLSMWEEGLPHQTSEGRDQNNYAWGMAIDLNKCTGCNACVVACQSENNIPVVGKDQVLRGREMHWIRIDRYFGFEKEGDEYDPNTVTNVMMQPLTCMQCENAPCEQVCPVAATVHDEDGINVMVYNRCIGTRYCSNNCPYKVRRFNYFDYNRREPLREQPGLLMQVEPDYYTKAQAGTDPIQHLQRNPEVTVRVRGVMEKCTYCVQRINEAKIKTKNEWVQSSDSDKAGTDPGRIPIPDGTIQTACSQACPAEAIAFGDLNDPESTVSKLQRDGRSYEMLEELNVKARTQYLAKLRNPGPLGEHHHEHNGGHGGNGHAEGGH